MSSAKASHRNASETSRPIDDIRLVHAAPGMMSPARRRPRRRSGPGRLVAGPADPEWRPAGRRSVTRKPGEDS